jgi:hypothetical protein
MTFELAVWQVFLVFSVGVFAGVALSAFLCEVRRD